MCHALHGSLQLYNECHVPDVYCLANIDYTKLYWMTNKRFPFFLFFCLLPFFVSLFAVFFLSFFLSFFCFFVSLFVSFFLSVCLPSFLPSFLNGAYHCALDIFTSDLDNAVGVEHQ